MDPSTNQAPHDDNQNPQSTSPAPTPTAPPIQEEQPPIARLESLQITPQSDPQQEHETTNTQTDRPNDLPPSPSSETNSLDIVPPQLPSVPVSWPSHPYAQEVGQTLIGLIMRKAGYDNNEQAQGDLMEGWGQYRALPSRESQPLVYRDGMQQLVERMGREVIVRLMVFDRVCCQLDVFSAFTRSLDGEWMGEERDKLTYMGF